MELGGVPRRFDLLEGLLVGMRGYVSCKVTQHPPRGRVPGKSLNKKGGKTAGSEAESNYRCRMVRVLEMGTEMASFPQSGKPDTAPDVTGTWIASGFTALPMNPSFRPIT